MGALSRLLFGVFVLAAFNLYLMVTLYPSYVGTLIAILLLAFIPILLAIAILSLVYLLLKFFEKGTPIMTQLLPTLKEQFMEPIKEARSPTLPTKATLPKLGRRVSFRRPKPSKYDPTKISNFIRFESLPEEVYKKASNGTNASKVAKKEPHTKNNSNKKNRRPKNVYYSSFYEEDLNDSYLCLDMGWVNERDEDFGGSKDYHIHDCDKQWLDPYLEDSGYWGYSEDEEKEE